MPPDKSDPYSSASFLTSAHSYRQCPPEGGVEVAFAGRSNAGKSSALNALTGHTRLARTSKTPGRTRLINFFCLGEDQSRRLVDLPGYGYAKAPRKTRQAWQYGLNRYLSHRECLKGLVLLVDSRHELKDTDRLLIEWSARAELPCRLLLTKADKLSHGAARRRLAEFEQKLAPYHGLSAQLFSATRGDGLKALKATLNDWLDIGA